MAVTWGILAIIFVGATAVGGSSIRRHSALERRVVTAESSLAERDARIAVMRDHAEQLRSHLTDTRTELVSTKRMLQTTRSLLEEAVVDIRTANDAAEQQRREMIVLKTCLAGAANALQYMAAANHYRALYVMTSVDRECREAHTLMTR